MSPSESSDIPRVLARRPPAEVAGYLRAVGDAALADELDAALLQAAPNEQVTFGVLASLFGVRQPPPWLHTAHAFGHISPAPPGDESQPIRYAVVHRPQNSRLAADKIPNLLLAHAADSARGA